MIKFASFTQQESLAVSRIQARAKDLLPKQISSSTFWMDLAAVHAHTPLRLYELSEADPVNFAHDVYGILRHIDRETGELKACFRPRYAK